MRLLRRGSRGNDVKELQKTLNQKGYNAGNVDGIFGKRTENAVKAFQRANGLVVDGIVGQNTRGKLGQVSSDGNVKDLQKILGQIGINIGKVDGKMGPKTRTGVKEFQQIFGLAVDGIAGPKTWAVLNKAKGVKRFKVQEFACKHCGKIKIDINLLLKLEELRRAIGNKPIVVTSGYRCPTHNKAVGGAANSQHKYGKAADIKARGMTPRQLGPYAEQVFHNGGVGLRGATIVHVDTRGYRARWYYN